MRPQKYEGAFLFFVQINSNYKDAPERRQRENRMKKFYMLCLQQFAEGAAGDSGAASSSQDAAGTTGEGTGQAAADGQETQRATFEEMLEANPDYKDAHNKSVQKAVRQRFAKAKAIEDRMNKAAPILSVMAAKYGLTDPNDLDALQAAMDKDDSLYEERAYRNGYTVEQQREIDALTAENNRLRADRQAAEEQRMRDAWLAQREAEAKALKQEFPDFDLNAMMQDEGFVNMIRPENPFAVPMRAAYIAMNADGIIGGAMNYTAQQVAKKTADTIRQRGLRPLEGGMSGHASSKAGVDVSKLSGAEILDYAKRAERGESIRFS